MQPSLPTPVSLSNIPTKLASLAYLKSGILKDNSTIFFYR